MFWSLLFSHLESSHSRRQGHFNFFCSALHSRPWQACLVAWCPLYSTVTAVLGSMVLEAPISDGNELLQLPMTSSLGLKLCHMVPTLSYSPWMLQAFRTVAFGHSWILLFQFYCDPAMQPISFEPSVYAKLEETLPCCPGDQQIHSVMLISSSLFFCSGWSTQSTGQNSPQKAPNPCFNRIFSSLWDLMSQAATVPFDSKSLSSKPLQEWPF